MCGISGFQGDFDPSLLGRMNDLLAHRGPDGEGQYYHTESSTGIAHRRLSIIDLSSLGTQPMWDATATVVVTFNGEIYNYRELRRDLVSLGYHFHSSTDTEVLLNLYLQHGRDMLTHLNGMFAFALFDTRDSTLFLARDGFGVKPLYYSELARGFIFASELKAILLDPSVPREISPKAVQCYVRYMWAPAPFTPLTAVRKLEPGWALIVSHSRVVKKWQFYALPYHQEIADMSVKEAAAEVRRTLEQAVRRQLVADVPLGAFLSGGLDSSSVAAAIRKYPAGGHVSHFTIRVKDQREEGYSDDLEHALLVAQHLGIQLHVMEGTEAVPTDLPQMIYYLDEPQADPACLHVQHIARAARKAGVKVLLSGAGGDDLFSGYRRHRALYLEKYWAWLPLTIRCLLSAGSRKLPVWTPNLRRIRKAFHYAALDGEARIASYFRWIEPEWEEKLYSDDIRAELCGDPSDEVLLDSLSMLRRDTPDLNKMLLLDAQHFLADHNLNYTDKMGMAEGVEIRVPYLDPDLAALAARLPLKFKQNGRQGKWILRKAAEQCLPRQVVYREKTGFGVTARAWFQNGLSDLCQDLLQADSMREHGIFNTSAVRDLVGLNHKGLVDAAYPLLAIICVELWLKTFTDVPVPRIYA